MSIRFVGSLHDSRAVSRGDSDAVTGAGKLVGIVTLDDLLRRLRYEVDSLLDVVAKEQDHERRTAG